MIFLIICRCSIFEPVFTYTSQSKAYLLLILFLLNVYYSDHFEELFLKEIPLFPD